MMADSRLTHLAEDMVNKKPDAENHFMAAAYQLLRDDLVKYIDELLRGSTNTPRGDDAEGLLTTAFMNFQKKLAAKPVTKAYRTRQWAKFFRNAAEYQVNAFLATERRRRTKQLTESRLPQALTELPQFGSASSPDSSITEPLYRALEPFSKKEKLLLIEFYFSDDRFLEEATFCRSHQITQTRFDILKAEFEKRLQQEQALIYTDSQ